MTVEEIKSTYSMRDVLQMYGMQANRAGFVFCPFHNEKGHASLKIYKRDYHCYGCGSNGDIFSFVQEMDRCDFKTAYLKMGGEYEKKSDWQRKKFEYELQQRKEREMKEQESKKQLKKDILNDISYKSLFAKCFPVFSDDWCKAVNRLEYDFYVLEELTREGVRLVD